MDVLTEAEVRTGHFIKKQREFIVAPHTMVTTEARAFIDKHRLTLRVSDTVPAAAITAAAPGVKWREAVPEDKVPAAAGAPSGSGMAALGADPSVITAYFATRLTSLPGTTITLRMVRPSVKRSTFSLLRAAGRGWGPTGPSSCAISRGPAASSPATGATR